MHPSLIEHFHDLAPPSATLCTLRLVDERHESIQVHSDITQPFKSTRDVGLMVTVIEQGGLGYAATSDLTRRGLRDALTHARDWAVHTAPHRLLDFSTVAWPNPRGEYHGPVDRAWSSLSLRDKLTLVHDANAAMAIDPRIVDRLAILWHIHHESIFVSTAGADVRQRFEIITPYLHAIAHDQGETQRRSIGYHTYANQAGAEYLDLTRFTTRGAQLADDALELLHAPQCPSDTLDLVIAPDQMFLQIHESIGHPLELDRILGDERNFAGRSFVTLDMFGEYMYGSKHLNITFDPTRQGELASYAFDDEGLAADKTYLIKEGRLLRPLGGALSQARARIDGVACSRACSWNRPPIDRMANINLEPGDQTLDEIIAGIEYGLFVESNRSWSIDDSRNKFQFGCESGHLIRNGQRCERVKNPNYRGISATFWRNLRGVGDASTEEVIGSPYCGKGEPKQVIRVGHATPVCHFTNIDVFGGDA